MTGWDHPDTVRYYDAFDRRHARYRAANRALVRNARMRPGQRVLDIGAGTGGTTAALLDGLGPAGTVDCVEPARAMRAAGSRRFDARVRWFASLEEAGTDYDRIVCGAGIWQWPDLAAALRSVASRLAPGGALAFNVPAAYLGEADRPGGGRDPWLTELLAALTRQGAARSGAAREPLALPAAGAMAGLLGDAGLLPRPWHSSGRLTQAAWRDWLKIPVLTDVLFAGLAADERARRIDAAYAEVDPRSWRHERWLGWTAWRPLFPAGALHDATPALGDAAAVQALAERDGYLYLPGFLPRADVLAVRRQALRAAAAAGLADLRGRWTGGRYGDGSDLDMYGDPRWIGMQQVVLALPAVAALARHPALCRVLEPVLGARAVPGQGSVCRVMAPIDVQAATAPHCDHQFVTRSNRLWTAWLPLGDCSMEQGPLAIAPGSHRHDGRGPDETWLTASLRAGDVLLFSTLTRHRGCGNFTDRVRLSADFRFAPEGDAV